MKGNVVCIGPDGTHKADCVFVKVMQNGRMFKRFLNALFGSIPRLASGDFTSCFGVLLHNGIALHKILRCKAEK